MRIPISKVGLAAGLAAATAVSIGLTGSASADSAAARTGDVVGVGSDTVQNAADFLFDGKSGVVGGYNVTGNNHRVYSIDASGDANGRATFDGTCGTPSTVTGLAFPCSATNAGAPNLLAGTVILRAGTNPVVRPNGSGPGYAALAADGQSPGYQGLPVDSINFSRASRLPKASEISTCDADSGCKGYHVFQFATDGLTIAHQASSFNGPAALSAQELYDIYVGCTITKWNQLPGNSTGSSDTIDAVLPQSGSGTEVYFLDDLYTATGTTIPSSGPPYPTCSVVRTAEEHDPTGIYGAKTPADAIEPFSTGKLSLINSGYFANNGYTASGFANGAYTPNYLATISPATTNAGDGNPSFGDTTRGLYFVVRQADFLASSNGTLAPLQSGGTQDYIEALFDTATSVIQKSGDAGLISAAGFTQNFKDCGVDPTTC